MLARTDHESAVQLLSVQMVANRLACSVKTVRRRIAAGDLAVIRNRGLLRGHPSDLRRFIELNRSIDQQ